MALWSAGIVLALALTWLGTEAYAMHRVEKVLIAELAPRPGSLWFPDFDGAAKKLGGPERTLRLLRRYLALQRPYRNEAIWFLGACGRPAVPDLIRYLQSSELLERHNAMRALGLLKAEAIDALPAIIETTKHGEQPIERRVAIITLRQVGGNLPDVIAALADALEDPDDETVAWAVPELAMIGPGAAPAVPGLAKVLTRCDPGTRTYAALTLGNIGPRAAAAVPALQSALADENGMVRAAAAESLKRIRCEEPPK